MMKTDKSIVLSKIKTLVKDIDRHADIILYGSRARGDEHPDSDWDILILVNSKTDLDYERIFRHRLYEIELEKDIIIGPLILPRDEWENKRYKNHPIHERIDEEGVLV